MNLREKNEALAFQYSPFRRFKPINAAFGLGGSAKDSIIQSKSTALNFKTWEADRDGLDAVDSEVSVVLSI